MSVGFVFLTAKAGVPGIILKSLSLLFTLCTKMLHYVTQILWCYIKLSEDCYALRDIVKLSIFRKFRTYYVIFDMIFSILLKYTLFEITKES